ncbi:MAG: transglutaminase-like domain-containing protein [bacterium]|nr:transglutaminase-like domain-containing protein [bacterium]
MSYLKKEVLGSLLSGGELPDEKLEKITRYVHKKVRVGETTGQIRYINPLFMFVKASPVQVNELGGECGDLVRLTVTLLRLSGISARRVHLYNVRGLDLPLKEAYTHAVVEVLIDGQWYVVDPTMGLMFRKADGSLTAMEELADNVLLSKLVGDTYDLELFNYQEVRRIRWDKFVLGNSIYRVLREIFGKSYVNSITYPAWAERPNLMFSVLFFAFAFCFSGIALRSRKGFGGATERISDTRRRKRVV